MYLSMVHMPPDLSDVRGWPQVWILAFHPVRGRISYSLLHMSGFWSVIFWGFSCVCLHPIEGAMGLQYLFGVM